MLPDIDPSIELVWSKSSGALKHCFILNKDGSRGDQLPIIEARERFSVVEPGIVSIDIHTFRVKWTEED